MFGVFNLDTFLDIMKLCSTQNTEVVSDSQGDHVYVNASTVNVSEMLHMSTSDEYMNEIYMQILHKYC